MRTLTGPGRQPQTKSRLLLARHDRRVFAVNVAFARYQRQKKPGAVECSYSLLLMRPIEFNGRSDRFPRAAHADRCGEECRGDCEAGPQTRVTEESTHSEWGQRGYLHAA